MDKIVTLTGAFKNAGDYLIGHRARALLRNHVDAEVIDVNRKEITDSHYELFNSARAVLLTGGPAYQQQIYPNVYNLDLSRIQVPVLAYGLGWKGKLGQEPVDFRFTDAAGDFVRAVHQDKTRFSSARDHLTVAMLSANGVENVAMTGCPAWYDETKLSQDYLYSPDVKRLVFSMPAVPQAQVPILLAKLAKDFPRAEKYLAFQAGYRSTHSKKAAEFTRWNYLQLAKASLRGFKPISFEADFGKFESFMQTVDFHVGYRVHSHIFSLSQRKTSMLIAEDSRGMGQVAAMGGTAVLASEPATAAALAIDELFQTRGEAITKAVETMRGTHQEMLRFLKQI
ncbi:MAG: polysaccharide pyruvyl transferase family protein [Micrococcales bacterium]